jgi:hypothetical protein
MVRQLESLMKLFAGMLVLTLLAATAAQGADNPNSVALTRAMRSDEIAVATAKRNFLNGSMAERYGKTNAGCVKRIHYADFTAGWARVIDSVLSGEEIDAALAFFKSDAGVKYVEGMLRRLRAREGGEVFPEVPGKEDISPAQNAAISDFSSSDLGRKVMGKDLIVSPAAEVFGRELLQQIAGKCGK